MRYREVEVIADDIDNLPKTLDCPKCFSLVKGPKYLCNICASQIVFIPPDPIIVLNPQPILKDNNF